MKRWVAAILSIVVLFTILPIQGLAEDKGKMAGEAKSAILMEQDTGTILYQKNINKKLPPASMTKIMTMLLIMEALDSGKINMDDKVRVSEYAASMGGSQIFLEEGEVMTVKNLLKGIAIGSANDASVAMAEYIAGSAEDFVNQMNKRAKQLGLKNTHFENATGLPAENHYSTALDMATMAKALLRHEKITKFTGMYEDYLREDTDNKFWLVNTNRLVKFYPGVDGLKTGYTNEAKYCLTATAEKNGMRVITVVMGAPTTKARNSQVTKLLDYAFNQFMTHPMYDRHEKIKQIIVDKGKENKVPVVTAEKVSILTKKGESPENVKKEIVTKSNIKAPLNKGQQVGRLVLSKDGKVLSKTPLIVKDNVKKASWWQLFKRTVSGFGMP